MEIKLTGEAAELAVFIKKINKNELKKELTSEEVKPFVKKWISNS